MPPMHCKAAVCADVPLWQGVSEAEEPAASPRPLWEMTCRPGASQLTF